MVKSNFRKGLIVGGVLIIMGVLLWCDFSFIFGGIGIMVIGGSILYYLNESKK